MVLTVARNTNAYRGTVFFEPEVNVVGYWLWRGGIIPSGPGAYAENARINRVLLRQQLRQHGLFCMAVPTIYRRFAGLEVPHVGNEEYDGGIYAAFGGDVGFGWQEGYFADVKVRFDAERAVAWARETRSCVLLGTPYKGVLPHQQGHTGVVLPSGYILQSVFGEGLHWMRTVFQEVGYWSQPGGVMVHPKKWIEDSPVTRQQRAAWARR